MASGDTTCSHCPAQKADARPAVGWGVWSPKMDGSPDNAFRPSRRDWHEGEDHGAGEKRSGGPAVQQLSATRSELIARRLQIGLATQGRDLLKEKRAALVVEFGHLSTGVLEAVETLGRRAAESAAALSRAVAFDGPEAVGSAAIAASGDITTRLSLRIVAGVPVVELKHDRISRARTGRGYGLVATTPRTDVAAASFERLLDLVLDVAASELSLRRLAGEISRTTRRVNAL